MKTFYDEALAFGEKVKRSGGGRYLEQRRVSWQNEVTDAMLRVQGHFDFDYEDLASITRSVKNGRTIKDLKKLKKYLRLPFPTCWIQISRDLGPASLPQNPATRNIRKMAFVLEQSIDPWQITLYTVQQKTPEELALRGGVAAPYAIAVKTILNDAELEAGTFNVVRGAWTSEESEQLSIDHFFSLSRLILFMNCRSGPFAFQSQDSQNLFANLPLPPISAYKVAVNNRQRNYILHKIIFDTSRIFRKSKAPDITSDEMRAVIDEILVRGHFKNRKTGLFFWSEYDRNVYGEPTDEMPEPTAPSSNSYKIIRSRPDEPLTLPDDPNSIIVPARTGDMPKL